MSNSSIRFPKAHEAAMLALISLCSGCGFLTAGATSAAGGDSNADPVGSDLSAPRSITSPASIFFRLNDQEGDTANVHLRFKNSQEFAEISLAGGSNPLSGVLGNGEIYEVLWDFAADLGGASYSAGIELQLTVDGGTSPPILTGVAMGNDAPEMQLAGPNLAGAEFEGVVYVAFAVRDSSMDLLKIKVEYNADAASGFPSSSWALARPSVTPPTSQTPTYAFTDFVSEDDADGAGGVFAWRSTFDVGLVETNVRMRFTPEDDFSVGVLMETAVFRVDNNHDPIATVDEAGLILNPDQRRGIPIPFRVYDDESDPVTVLVQWTRKGEAFPVLPTTRSEMLGLLEDPAMADQARALQVATEAPVSFGGRVGVAVSGQTGNQVRLPELGGSAAGLLAHGIAGRTVEILRPAASFESLAWQSSPLSNPVALLSSPDGRSAQVLGGDAASWILQEVDLETGSVMSTAPLTGGGEPQAMSLDPTGEWLFVASSTQVFRFKFPEAIANGALPHPFGGGIRDIAALGSDAVVVTQGSSLMHLDFTSGTVNALLTGLNTPWGVVCDPLQPSNLYLAERGADRLVAIELNGLSIREVEARVNPFDFPSLGSVALPSPTSIAIERSGEQMLVLTGFGSGPSSLRGVLLRSPHDTEGLGRADAFVFQISDQVGHPAAGLATGPDGLRLAALPNSDKLSAGGGVAQSRTIVGAPPATGGTVPYDPLTQVVLLVEPFAPLPPAGAQWRIHAPLRMVPSSPLGRGSVFVWDSTDVYEGGEVVFRVIPIDSDIGVGGAGTSSKMISAQWAVPPSYIPGASDNQLARSVVPADLDGDGDLDLVVANASGGPLVGNLTLHFQEAKGVFGLDPITLFGFGSSSPQSVVAADLDGDGKLDLAAVDLNRLHIFLQTGPGLFSPIASGPLTVPGAISLGSADLNGDGLTDLFSANSSSDGLTIFFQSATAPGTFVLPPTQIDGPPGSNPIHVLSADLDDDGDLDLVVIYQGLGDLIILFNDGAGQFTVDPSGPLIGPSGSSPEFAAAADLDGDGDIDLVAAYEDSGALAIFFQTAPGVLGLSTVTLIHPSLVGPRSVIPADIDGDGDLDLVATGEFGNPAPSFEIEVITFTQTSPGEFEASEIALEDSVSFGYPTVAACPDLDGDGQLDLILLKSGTSFVSNPIIYYQASLGQYGDSPGVLVDPLIGGPFSLASGDLDGDGDHDIASANFLTGVVSIAFNDGVSFSVDAVSLQIPDFLPVSVDLADLDGDGDLDLVVANGYSSVASNLVLFFNDGQGQFTVDDQPPLSGGIDLVFPECVVAEDVDGDGDRDIISANPGSGTLTIFINDGLGQFPSPPIVLEGAGSSALDDPRSVVVADIDSDGEMDLVTADFFAENLVVFYGNGQNQFTSGSVISAGLPVRVVAADLDGDGDLDLASASASPGSLDLFLQTAPRVFEFSASLNAVDPRDIAVADLDGDGDLDLVSPQGGANVLHIYFQVAPGKFNKDPDGKIFGSDMFDPRHVLVADFDGDGELDLVSANYLSNNLTIYYGGH